jgi:hypothetical protein
MAPHDQSTIEKAWLIFLLMVGITSIVVLAFLLMN